MATLKYDVKQNHYICSKCGKVIGPADCLCPHCLEGILLELPKFDQMNIDDWIRYINILMKRETSLDYVDMMHLRDFLIKLKGEQKDGN